MNVTLITALVFVLAAVALALWSGFELFRKVPESDRRYQDPLPGGLRILWPLVRAGEFYIGRRLPPHQLEKIHARLERSAVDFLLTPEQFIGMCIAAAIVTDLLVWWVLVLLKISGFNFWMLLCLGAAAGFAMPWLWLSDRRKKRRAAIVKELATHIDFITLGIEGGLNLSGAMRQASLKGPDGVLSREFARVLRDVRAGLSRSDALRRMAERTDVKEITNLTSALIQAEKSGASLSQVLRVQSEQRGEERFQRAEKAALEAPIKMMFPLVVFFFPLIFCLIGFFIYVQFMNSGAM